jgi:hypothetical protein
MLDKFVTAAIVFISGYFYWLSSLFNSLLLRLETEGNTELGACNEHTNTQTLVYIKMWFSDLRQLQ